MCKANTHSLTILYLQLHILYLLTYSSFSVLQYRYCIFVSTVDHRRQMLKIRLFVAILLIVFIPDTWVYIYMFFVTDDHIVMPLLLVFYPIKIK